MANPTWYAPQRLWCRLFVCGALLVAGCREPAKAPVAAAPRPAPTATEVVQHYADLMAAGTRLTTAKSRQFGDSVSYPLSDDGAFGLGLVPCDVQAWMTSTQRLERVTIDSPPTAAELKANAAGAPIDFSRRWHARLMKLGELRRLFGPGTIGVPQLFEAASLQRFPVEFTYTPSATGHRVLISAAIPTPNYNDSVMVDRLSLNSFE